MAKRQITLDSSIYGTILTDEYGCGHLLKEYEVQDEVVLRFTETRTKHNEQLDIVDYTTAR